MLQLIKLQWLSFRRSPSFEKDVLIKLFLLVVGVLFLFNLYFLASDIPGIIRILKLEISPVSFVNSLVFYYFFFEIVIRYFMQSVPVLDIEPYLHLPIPRRLIGRFIIIKSVFSYYNLIPLVLFLPIFLNTVLPVYGFTAGLYWFLFIFLTSIALHFFNIIFKKRLDDNSLTWIIIGIIVLINIATNYFEINFQLIPIEYILSDMNSGIFWLFIPLGLTLFFITLCFNMFSSNLYLEDMSDQKLLSNTDFTTNLTKWEGKGIINSLIIQELKLILRHKRSKSTLIVALVFLLYPLILLNRGDDTSPILFILASIFCSGSFILNYGQFLWSWNTNQMDFFLTKINPYTAWLESRYRLLLYSAAILATLSLPYFLIDYEILIAIAATTLYNIGINTPIIMRLSLWGPKPIDLNKSSMMNYQGTGAAQFVLGIPIILGPLIVYGIGAIAYNHYLGYGLVAAFGFIGILLRKHFFNQIAKKLKKDKYALIANLNL